ncbi:MAG: (d)CMP kinase [Prevotellaceae bacterium]|jgi:cytidylate kinase|nr:(d)CMP kinase [Prevotellaceae bacterium]
MKDIIIAIDGYSSCGKSTFAKAIAAALGYTFIDSGAMYRAVTLYALRHGLVAGDGRVLERQLVATLPRIDIRLAYSPERGASDVFLNGENVSEELRLTPVAGHVSRVSELAEVRRRMVAMQQEMGRRKAIVMDGRDIGTVVFPQAELKIFMTAAPEIRAMRRYQELLAKGASATLEEIERSVRQRDETDENRAVSPLRKAPDAVLLDNSHLSVGEQLAWVMQRIRQKQEEI